MEGVTPISSYFEYKGMISRNINPIYVIDGIFAFYQNIIFGKFKVDDNIELAFII